MKRSLLAIIVLLLFSAGLPAQTSIDQGDWLVRIGYTYIDPTSSGLNTPIGKVTAESAGNLTFNGTYMFTQNLGLELLAALPVEHDLELDGVKIGKTKQLPPTLSLQWHQPIGRVVPYVGVGVNWTLFFDEKLNSGDNLDLDDSWGFAAQLGFDFVLNDKWLLNADIRYIGIETDASLNGTKLGSVDVNPWTYGFNIGYKF